MKVEVLISAIGADFYTGVPDSYLKPLSDYLNNTYSNSRNHIIAANEGNCVAIATGYHLATQKYPVVYLQNSGEGHIINPLLSLTHEMLYAIPIIFIIGWRGEPGGHDEPQHIQQGKLTLRLLKDIGITTFVIDTNTSECELVEKMRCFRALLKEGKSVSFVVKKGALTYDKKGNYQGSTAQICREVAIRHIMNVAGESPIVSSTGKISRELFELREETGQGHERDFLTIGSMGHASSIALGLALQKNNTKVFCIDGDGSLIMHMGALAVIGEIAPNNFVHIVVNNCAHETVGGAPTAAAKHCLASIAKQCGYTYAVCVEYIDDLIYALKKAKKGSCLSFIEVKCNIGSRANLGRPRILPNENKIYFMKYIHDL